MAIGEVTVRGGGIFALACGWELARRGARVTVVAPRGIGDGASGGVVGALAPHVPEAWNQKKAFQLDALLMAGDWWREVAAASGRDPLYARTGRLQPLADAAAVERALARAAEARALWRGKAVWEVTDDPGDPAWAPPAAAGLWIRDTLSARIAPRAALAALARAIDAAGGRIVTEAEPAGTELWATGWEGLRDLSADLGRPVGAPVKGQAALLSRPAPDSPQLFAEGLHIVPHGDGTVAVGSTSERDAADPFSTDGRLDALIDRARDLCPALASAPVVERWAGLRPRARSRAPMLGAWPGRPGHYVANGGFKIGVGIAPKVADTMAALILDGRDTVPEGFRVADSL